MSFKDFCENVWNISVDRTNIHFKCKAKHLQNFINCLKCRNNTISYPTCGTASVYIEHYVSNYCVVHINDSIGVETNVENLELINSDTILKDIQVNVRMDIFFDKKFKPKNLPEILQ